MRKIYLTEFGERVFGLILCAIWLVITLYFVIVCC